jgi:hypothetical protein
LYLPLAKSGDPSVSWDGWFIGWAFGSVPRQNQGNAVTEQEFKGYLAIGHESDGIEFKGPGKTSDKAYFAKVVRAVLGMANRRDGGTVIIGVEDNGNSLSPKGLDESQVKTWEKYDVVSGRINRYASPNISFELETPDFGGQKFAVLRVHQFVDIPILCREDYHNEKDKLILRQGACYVRARHKPETSELPSEEEMRELLELAIDLGVKKFVRRAREAGLFPPTWTPTMPTDEEQFEKQIEEME